MASKGASEAGGGSRSDSGSVGNCGLSGKVARTRGGGLKFAVCAVCAFVAFLLGAGVPCSELVGSRLPRKYTQRFVAIYSSFQVFGLAGASRAQSSGESENNSV